MGLILWLILCLSINLVFAEYLVKTEKPLPNNIFIKKIGEDIYLIKEKNIPDNFEGVIEENYPLLIQRISDDPCNVFKWEYEKISIYEAWELITGNENIYIALLDTGIDYNHPDLQKNIWRNPEEVCYDGLDNDGNGYIDDCYGVNILCYPEGRYDPHAPGCNAPDALDDNGHGTHIAGIIGAIGNNTYLISGLLWNVKIIPCKFLDSTGFGTIAGELACLEYIKQLKEQKGLNIVAVNASYGNYYPKSRIQEEAIKSLKDLGILYITASGNESKDITNLSFFPCNYDLENIICVGAFGKDLNLTFFSNYSFFSVDILAPGEDILSLFVQRYSGLCNRSLVGFSGTSMSAPFVSATIAMLKSLYPEMTIEEIKYRIITGGKNLKELDGLTYSCNVLDVYEILQNDPKPKACLSEKVLIFEKSYVGFSPQEFLIVRNTGNVPIKIISAYNLSENFTVDVQCINTEIKPLEECVLVVTFNPVVSGTFEDKLYIKFNYPSLDREVILIGIYKQSVSFTESSYNQDNQDNQNNQETVPYEGNTDGSGCNTGFSMFPGILVLILVKLLNRLRILLKIEKYKEFR